MARAAKKTTSKPKATSLGPIAGDDPAARIGDMSDVSTTSSPAEADPASGAVANGADNGATDSPAVPVIDLSAVVRSDAIIPKGGGSGKTSADPAVVSLCVRIFRANHADEVGGFHVPAQPLAYNDPQDPASGLVRHVFVGNVSTITDRLKRGIGAAMGLSHTRFVVRTGQPTALELQACAVDGKLPTLAKGEVRKTCFVGYNPDTAPKVEQAEDPASDAEPTTSDEVKEDEAPSA